MKKIGEATRLDRLPKERAREIQSMGGKAAGEKRRQAKTFKQALEWAMDMPAFRSSSSKVEKVLKQFPGITNREALAIAMVVDTINKADAKSFLAIRDTIGESPAQLLSVAGNTPMTIAIETVTSASAVKQNAIEAPATGALDAPKDELVMELPEPAEVVEPVELLSTIDDMAAKAAAKAVAKSQEFEEEVF